MIEWGKFDKEEEGEVKYSQMTDEAVESLKNEIERALSNLRREDSVSAMLTGGILGALGSNIYLRRGRDLTEEEADEVETYRQAAIERM